MKDARNPLSLNLLGGPDPVSTIGSDHFIRGSHWNSEILRMHSEDRFFQLSWDRSNILGFRLARISRNP